MSRYYQKSFKFKVLEFIQQMSAHVILREDVKNMGSSRQVSRCLQELVKMRKLIKIGYGVYAKTDQSEYLNSPMIKGGFDLVCKEALTKLGINWEPGSLEKAYNTGQSTQVPVRTVIRLKSRFRRNFSYGNRKLIIEKKINAR